MANSVKRTCCQITSRRGQRPSQLQAVRKTANRLIVYWRPISDAWYRYHYNVSAHRLEVHVAKGLADGLFISSAACAGDLWAVIMDAGNGYSEQQYIITDEVFMPKNWIMEQWDKGLYITSLAGLNASCLTSALTWWTSWSREKIAGWIFLWSLTSVQCFSAQFELYKLWFFLVTFV